MVFVETAIFTKQVQKHLSDTEYRQLKALRRIVEDEYP
jgi:hypothetical protein